MAEVLREEGYQVCEAADGPAALRRLAEVDVDVVLCDLRMPGTGGLTVLKTVRELYPQAMVLLMTAYASVETVVEALRLGAQDYLLKPLLIGDVLHRVRRLLEHKRQALDLQLLRRERTRHFDFAGLVGRSPAMREAFALTNLAVLRTAPLLFSYPPEFCPTPQHHVFTFRWHGLCYNLLLGRSSVCQISPCAPG